MEKKFRKLVYIVVPDAQMLGDREVIDSDRAYEMAGHIDEFVDFAYHNDAIPLAVTEIFRNIHSRFNVEETQKFQDQIILMGKCDTVWVLANDVTESMLEVINRAKLRHKLVRYFHYVGGDQMFEEVGGLE